jgi:hypothetical protein
MFYLKKENSSQGSRLSSNAFKNKAEVNTAAKEGSSRGLNGQKHIVY